MRLSFSLIVLVLLHLGSPLSAKAAIVSPMRTAEAGTTDRGSDSSADVAEVTASQDTSTVSVKIGKTKSKQGGLFTSWSLTASAPLSKKKESTDLATLDGLANSFALAFKYQQFRAPGVLAKRDAHYEKESAAICENKLPAAYLAATGKPWNPESDENNCDTDTVQEYLPDSYLAFKSLYWDSTKWKILWGLEGRVGYETFEFQEPGGEPEDVSKSPSSAKLFVSFNPPKSSLLISVGGEYQRAYKGAKEATVCPMAAADETTVTCVTGAPMAPSDDNKGLAFVELRYVLSSHFATSLQVTRDFKNHTTGVDLPVYFLGDKDGLRGGVRLGWRDDERELKLGVFVGKVFNIFR